jgi:hypothetical protein
MWGAFNSTSVDMSHNAWATAFAKQLARCGGYDSVHTAHSWLMPDIVENISEVRGAIGSSVEVLTDTTMYVKLPNGNDGGHANVGILQ